MGFGQVTYNGPAFATRAAYYTAKDLGGTAIADTVQDGYVFCVDHVNKTITAPTTAPALAHFAAGGTTIDLTGVAVTKPEDGASGDNLTYFAGIGLDIAPSTNEAGWIWLMPGGAAIDCYVGVNTTTDPLVILGPVTAQWYLAAITPSVASGAAMMKELAKSVALALVTDATLTATPANIKCRVGGVCGHAAF